ncbi:uncharacterized protein LOC142981007 [Anticarsia gemmatalis]|uniref:uncharacterized protein LOC142981007 n=1 Tax=Anticarsia gemmatalis TaxID=129554 RepID=UPI003F75C765
MNNYRTFLIFSCLFCISLCEVSEEKKAKLLSNFIEYYNHWPSKVNTASDGVLQSIIQEDQTTYQIEVTFKVEDNGPKPMKCSATIHDMEEGGIALVNNIIDCGPLPVELADDENTSAESAEALLERGPVKLDNEVQADTAITSGEQFIAIPRDQPSAPCIGCASHVNPQAPGVSDLAGLGIRHLDLHEPTVKHTLDSVIDVERQVQVVNGVRYILTLSVNFDNCTEAEPDNCISAKVCRITVLVKPWETLPSGGKYRAILANNCTEEWIFGDNGEVLPEPIDTHNHNATSLNNDDVKVVQIENVEALPNQEKKLTVDEIKAIEEQIIPYDQSTVYSEPNKEDSSPTDNNVISKDHVNKVESVQQHSENSLPESSKSEPSNLSQDKKKAIDDMLDFFNFSGYKPRPQTEEVNVRARRSYDYDLRILSLTEEYQDIKKSIENAKFVYEMAQAMVDYLNEMDIEVKNRAVKNVIKAEEEYDNDKRFIYIQAQIVIPCDTANCESKETETKICNAVIDSTERKNPQMLNTFCYIDTKEMDALDKIKEVPLDDPVLLRLTKEIIRKMESESKDPHALKIKKIVSANTRTVPGRLTKISLIVNHMNCSKSVPLVLRTNCSVLEKYGSNICEVIVHEKHSLKEKKIMYTCTERPVDMTISKFKQTMRNITVDDPKLNDILQEALQALEVQSNRKNKQKIVNVSKISTQIIAGLLTKIEFEVGFTNCTDDSDMKIQSTKCELLKNERLRNCKAQIWDRSWIVDGKQMEVSCDNDTSHFVENIRKKRALDIESRRVKRQLGAEHNLRSKSEAVGESQVQDPKDEKYTQLAHESLQKYLADTGNGRPHRVVRVEKVSTQVVSGLRTIIDFVVTPTDDSSGDSIKCNSEIWEQPWIKKKEITKVSCQIENPRSKRQVPGGLKEQDPNDPKYSQLASESLQKYLADTGNGRPHRVVRVEKVSTQVVSGLRTIIDFVVTPTDDSSGDSITCNSEIWEQAWLNKKEITKVSCQIETTRIKRQVPGGIQESDPNREEYLQLANESLQKYLADTGTQRPHRVVRVEKVTEQVVEGSLTRINFVATPSDDASGDNIRCYSEVWDRPWLNKKEIDVSCVLGTSRSKRGLAGGLKEQDPKDPKYSQLANESLQKYLADTGNGRPHRLVRVEKVSTQVVSGLRTIIDFVVTPSDDSSGDSIKCNSEIWEQAWLNKKEITKVSCQIENSRSKRQVPGGLKEQDPNDPKYSQLASESLQKYLADTGNGRPHRVVRVEKVSTQVVSGLRTIIDFVVTPTDDSSGDNIKCNSEIWEQAWLNKKEITKVSCQIETTRIKRQVPGGIQESDPNREEYLQLANESLQKYLADTGTQRPHRVVRVEKVTEQVVEGFLTRINFVATPSDNASGDNIRCYSEVWDRPWLNKKEIDVSCVLGTSRSKRGLAGGLKEQDPKDPKYSQLANESLQKYLADTGNGRPHRVVRVEKVSTQVVSGLRTIIDFVVTPTDDSSGDNIKCNSEIWEQAWLNKKEITKVSCQIENARSKRQVPGGLKEQDPNDHKYTQLANESLQKYLADTGNGRSHRVVRVEKVSTQVVSGLRTIIDFVVTPTDDSSGDNIKCNSEIWEQAWLNKKEITKVSCQIVNTRSKRQVPGGIQESDPNREEYLQLANESLQKYLADTGTQRPHRVVRVEKVTEQVVEGFLTRINFVATPSDNASGDNIRCYSEVWDRPWLNKKEIDVSCVLGTSRSKRGLAGGLKEQDPKDPKYSQLANESLQKYLADTGNGRPHRLVRVEKVSTQVVSGLRTIIDFVVTPSDDSSGDNINCNSEIWEQAWLNKKEITKVSCQIESSRSKRQVPGGLKEQDPNDPEYSQLANESLQKYLADTGNGRPHRVVRVEKVSTQVVSGVRTIIDFVVTPSDDSSAESIKCHSEIWEQAWLNKKEITKVSCQIENTRSKRQVPGGIQESDPNREEYLQLANESLQKYLADTGTQRPHRVVRVEKVTEQVVEGSLTRINFVATPSDNASGDNIRCYSEVWDRPWLNKKEIDVSCVLGTSRSKRGLAGGLKEQDPKDPKYSQLANESLQKYLADTGNGRPHRLVRVEKVSTQVVSGLRTIIDFVVTPSDDSSGDNINCNSEIWEQAWLNKKEITKVSCQIESSRSKRQVPGGLKEQDPNDPEYSQLANESLQKYLADTGNGRPHRVVRVEKVSTQVVSGLRTIIDFVVTPTDDSSGDNIKCNSEIWEQAWLNKKEITKVSCQIVNTRSKRQVPGGIQESDPNREEYLQLANESLQKYLADTGTQRPHRVVRVEKVTEQVVEGSLTRINFVATPSDNASGDNIRCYSEVWDRPWLNKKEIDVSCVLGTSRSKRGLAGGLKEQDPKDPKYSQLANESLQKYLADTGNGRPHRVVRVEKVSTQVVSGLRTIIDFVVTPTDDSSGDSIKCNSEIWEQAWLNKKEITKVSCQIETTRIKRQVPGGIQESDPNREEYLQLANESLQKYLADTGTQRPHRVVRVEKVTEQVVEGSLTRINFVATPSDNASGDNIRCYSEVWDRPWLNKKEIDVSCVLGTSRSKRGLAGGLKEQDPKDPKYSQLANESLQKYLADTGNGRPHRLVRVEKVSTQVVSGLRTIIDFVVTPSDDSSGDSIKCNSEIWEQAWLNKKEITKMSCQIENTRSKRQVPGGLKEQDPNDLEYSQLANESLQKYLADTGNGRPHRVVRVEKVSTQVVSGVRTIIDFVVTPTDDSSGDSIKCNSEIWEQAWLNKKEITKVSCQIENSRSKRQVPGGLKEQDPNDPEYSQLANESLQKYLADTGNGRPHRVVRVEKVSTQVVSGVRTIIDFVVTPSDDSSAESIKCHSEIWEQAWLNKKEITKVSCQIKNARSKRQVPGGIQESDPNREEYLQLANESLQKYLADTGTQRPHRVVRVEKVTEQVVEGSLTRINFVATPSDSASGDNIRCYSEVWDRPWLNKKEIDVSCVLGSSRSKRGLAGGLKEQDPNDPKYSQLANESLQKYLADTGNGRPHRVVRVEKVSTQVVSGLRTIIDFVVTPSDDSSGDSIKCNSEIWEQAWLNKKEITKVSCQIESSRSKRQVPGGLKEQDPNDHKYTQLANESLQKYLADTGNDEPHRVIRVVKVTTQVVAGSITRLNFVVLPMNTTVSDIINCYSEVLEQSWLNNKEYKVSCQQNSNLAEEQTPSTITKKNPNDSEYFQLATESLQKYLIDTNNLRPYEVIRVDDVTTEMQGTHITRIHFVASPIDNLNEGEVGCYSEILQDAMTDTKDYRVFCELDLSKLRQKREVVQSNTSNNGLHRRKNTEEEQDITKPEFKLLAIQSLRKFSKKNGVLHKLHEIQRVTMKVVSGIKYKLYFSASPTECSVNVSRARALTCKAVTNVTLQCDAEVWDQPWLGKKKIDIICDKPDDDFADDAKDEEEEVDHTDAVSVFNAPKLQSQQKELRVKSLAEEALEQYQSFSNTENVYKIVRIYKYYEHVADGLLSKIEFSISPTTCLRHERVESVDNCPFKVPSVLYNCIAKIREQPWLGHDKDIKVSCKRLQNDKKKTKKRMKRQIDIGQADDDDNEVDEDNTYYYADRAVQNVNDNSGSNNLYKLVTIHAAQTSVLMKTTVVKMYIELAETYCLRHHIDVNLDNCEEMEGLTHKLCLARIYPSPYDEMVVRHVSVVCDDNEAEFSAVTGLTVSELLRISILELEKKPENHYKLVHHGEPQLVPSLDANVPVNLNFIVSVTNCTPDVDLSKNPFQCYVDTTTPSKSCSSFIWLDAKTRTINNIDAFCYNDPGRHKRSIMDTNNATAQRLQIRDLVIEALEKLEMASTHRYKQRVLHINSHSSKITTGRVTTIDFDVGYTSCLKYEWIDNITNCDFLEHLPRRHCVAQIWERLWIKNGKHIDVSCEDDETPLEAHIEFESAEMAMQLAQDALKHIEAKYPHPKKQKIVRIFSLEKQAVAGVHYRMKVEVGLTDCAALSDEKNCKLNPNLGINKFCRVNIWVRPWTNHPPSYRVSCDFQEGASIELYHHVQAEHLFLDFIATYNPSYTNDHAEMEKRFDIFKSNIKKIHELNTYEKGTALYGVTRYTDLTYKEFRSRYMGLKMSLRDGKQPAMKVADIPSFKLPSNFDWREFNAVTGVKDQGTCASSWAFSIAGNIEGMWKIQSGQLVSLSEQQLVDCDKLNEGCSGGTPENAYRSIEEQGGVELESNYVYEGEGYKCLTNETSFKVHITGALNISSNETEMAQWLVHNGPISIGINARVLQFYLKGISHPWTSSCNSTDIDHAGLIVGYGAMEHPLYPRKIPYWLVKNSWGTGWGEEGYFRVFRGDGTCGVNRLATSAIV